MGSPGDFRKDLESLINRHSMEQASNTPDFILAKLMCSQLDAFETASREREAWYGCVHVPGQGRTAAPGPLEVAIGALEEIAKPGLARWPSGWERHGYPDKVVEWTHGCMLKTRVGGDCDNPECRIVIASRALATIRVAARPGEAKGTGEAACDACEVVKAGLVPNVAFMHTCERYQHRTWCLGGKPCSCKVGSTRPGMGEAK